MPATYPVSLTHLIDWTASASADRAVKTSRFVALLRESRETTLPYLTLKVTGTNGKGSVCAMLEACLRRAGLSVGLFTSPHLWLVTERFRVNGRDVEWSVFERHAADVERQVRAFAARRGDDDRPSFFEVLLLVALRLFREQHVDVAIFEGGVGGYNDVVSLLPGVMSMITNVALDHQDRLGGSLESIAADKAGMASDGSVLVLGPGIAPSLCAVIGEDAARRDVGIVEASFAGLRTTQRGARPTRVEIDDHEGTIAFDMPLLGGHQIENLATVVSAIRVLVRAGVVRKTSCLDGIEHVRWAGRTELLREGTRRFLLDVAHNEDGIRALAACLDDLAPPDERVLLYGAGAKKDYPACLPHLPRIAPTIYLVDGFYGAESARSIASQLPSACTCAGVFPSPAAALDALRDRAEGGILIATGSVFLVGEIRHHLQPHPGEGDAP
jgi:dihydrofolate synthase/folylpolyglutamate synthase